MPSLFELNNQLASIDAILDGNTDAETSDILESAKDELLKAIDGKIENILDYIAECKSRAEFLKSEEDRLAAKRKSVEKRIDWLKNMVFSQMKLCGAQKAEYGTWTCSIAKTPPKIIIDDETNVPECCKKTVVTIDKTELKKYIWENEYRATVDGKDVLVAHLEQGESLRIK